MTVLFFARSRELAGTGQLEVDIHEVANTSQLWQWLLEHHPSLAEIRSTTVFALNQEYLEPGTDASLRDGDEVALIPPISGG